MVVVFISIESSKAVDLIQHTKVRHHQSGCNHVHCVCQKLAMLSEGRNATGCECDVLPINLGDPHSRQRSCNPLLLALRHLPCSIHMNCFVHSDCMFTVHQAGCDIAGLQNACRVRDLL